MRLKIVRTPTQLQVDGIRLDGFHPGSAYEFGTTLAILFLAEGWAIPTDPSVPSLPMAAAELEAGMLQAENLFRAS